MRPRNPEATISQTGRRVGELRRKWKVTQEWFAERAGISIDYVQVIEHGRANLTLYSLTQVANALQVGVDELTRIPIRREPWPTGRPPGKKRGKKVGRQHRPLARPRNPEATVRQTGRRVGELRTTLELSQQHFAKRAGISVGYVHTIESGRANLTLRSLTRVANALQVEVSELTKIPERGEAAPKSLLLGKRKATRRRTRRKRQTSVFRGVSWNARRERWCATIAHKGKRWFLGYFEQEEDAARAYDAKAKVLKGDKAKLNFP